MKRRLTRVGNRHAVLLYKTLDGRRATITRETGILVVTTAGLRTNAQHSTCVRYINTSEGFVVWGTGSGSPRDPDWFENLRRSTVAQVRIGAERRQVQPRELVGQERDAVWSDIVREQFPAVVEYAKRAQRTISVAILAARKANCVARPGVSPSHSRCRAFASEGPSTRSGQTHSSALDTHSSAARRAAWLHVMFGVSTSAEGAQSVAVGAVVANGAVALGWRAWVRLT